MKFAGDKFRLDRNGAGLEFENLLMTNFVWMETEQA
jgi:hypothetical protein